MKVYKSYFGQLKKLPKELLPVSIACVTPKWWTGLTFREVAPSAELLSLWKSGKLNQTAFRSRYYTELDRKFTPENLIKELETLTGGKDCVLLCYEKTGEFCHRNLLGDYLASYDVKEVLVNG